MNLNTPYKTITREQFLFHEMRTVAVMMMEGKSDIEIIEEVFNNNLFQYPTERMIKNLTRVCLKRLHNLEDKSLVDVVANGSTESAKQVCLYAMMKYYRLVWDFMTTVIAEKFRTKDFSFSKRDVNVFFTRLQEQNVTISSWSPSTIYKCGQVLVKILVENGYLDSPRSEELHPVLIDFQLKNRLLDNREYVSLAVFNCFEEE